MSRSKVLIAGGLGVVGRAALEYFEGLDDWDIVALSRRRPDFKTRARFVSVDLRNADECERVLGGQSDVTHVVFAALSEQTGAEKRTETDNARVNVQMLSTLVDCVEKNSTVFRHITLMQGGKAYGVHLGPPPTIPSRETDGRTMTPNFYFDQEDLIIERQRGKRWTWTVLRPPSVCGFAIGSPMNMLLLTGIFASVCRELGLPLRFPGVIGHLKDTCDSGLLAKAIVWCGTTPAAQNQIFNISNGDCFLWEALFPKVAELFKMPAGAPHALSMARTMPGKGELWDRIVKRYDLKPYALRDLIPTWDYADFTYRYQQAPFHSLLSTIKIRKAGFHDCIDSERMLLDHLRRLQEQRVLPF